MEEVRRLGAGFHVLLARLAGNDLLAQTLDQLVGRIALILLLYQHEYDKHTECLQDEHAQLIALIESGSTEEALALLRSHLHTVEVSLGADAPDDEEADPHLSRALRRR
jgi:DNA-binding GntR family transcriptional regulator